MGLVTSKSYTKKYHEQCRELQAKIQVLEEEIKDVKHRREQEARVYEQKVVVFASKEEEWKRERKKHREEVTKLRKRLKEEKERTRSLEDEVAAANRGNKESNGAGTDYLMERMKEEQARRDEAVEKWKQLYLAIKAELDDLIQRTRQGFCRGVKEGMIEELHMELKTKEENLETLRSRLAAMENEGIKRDREIDILRQSLRILNHTRRNRIRKNPHKIDILKCRGTQSATYLCSINPQ